MARVLALLFCLVLASGCLNASDDDTRDADQPAGAPIVVEEPLEADEPRGAEAGTQSSHGEPQRDDGSVTVAVEGTSFVARRTITITNDFGGASRSAILAGTLNGDVQVGAGGSGGYRLVADLHGRGTTEQQARDELDRLTLANDDDLQGDDLRLSFVVTQAPQPPQTPLPVTIATGGSGGATFTLDVPPQPAHDLTLDSSNGDVVVTGLHGSHLVADSSNGGIDVSGAFDTLQADSSNGAIKLEGTFNDIRADSSNGHIEGRIVASRSATQRFDTSNDDISLVVLQGNERGFDVTASTSNGETTITLDGGHASGEDDAQVRTDGFASKQIRVTMELDTSNGDITLTSQ